VSHDKDSNPSPEPGMAPCRVILLNLILAAQVIACAWAKADAPERTHVCQLLLEVHFGPVVSDTRDRWFLSSFANRRDARVLDIEVPPADGSRLAAP
jgi:hypothetical protein